VSRPLFAVVGPTATGKSLVADALAYRLGGEVVSADSMQVYRGMDIGTAKTPIAERSVAYHGIDLVDPADGFTAALYQRYARQVIADIQSRDKPVVFCGGTGLYIRAALDDFQLDEGREAEGSGSGGRSRAQLQQQAAELGAEGFHALLAERDPASAALIHPNNVRRVLRALELCQQGTSYVQASAGFSRFQAVLPTRFIGLTVQRDLLYELINARVDAMLAAGLLQEVEALLARGLPDDTPAMQAIGYKELVGVLRGSVSLAEATEDIKRSTRRLAKRQETWFKRDPRIEWHDLTELCRGRCTGSLTAAEFAEAVIIDIQQTDSWGSAKTQPRARPLPV